MSIKAMENRLLVRDRWASNRRGARVGRGKERGKPSPEGMFIKKILATSMPSSRAGGIL